MIEFKEVSKSFVSPGGSSSLTVLDKVSLTIPSGKSAAVVGPSGSGKTTLLSLTAGLDTPSIGEVLVLGSSMTSVSEEDRTAFRLENIGFVFQTFELISTLSALENVMVPAELKGDKDCERKAQELLKQVGLAKREHHLPSELSGGERQRVAIARAFINKPQILLADEPTGNLDRKTGLQIEALLFDLNRELGTTLFIATHDPRLAEQCDFLFTFDEDGILRGEQVE